MNKYTYIVYNITFFVACQIAAMVGVLLTFHETAFEVTIKEIDDDGLKQPTFTFMRAAVANNVDVT